MMVPFDGAAGAVQSSGQHGGGGTSTVPRTAMTPGQHGVPPNAMNSQQHHGQSMNSGYQHPSSGHRQPSSGQAGGHNFNSLPQSPSTRQQSFGGGTNAGVHYPPHAQPNHHSIRSLPSHQQQNHQMRANPQVGVGQMGMSSMPAHSNMGAGMQENRQRSYNAPGISGNWQSEKDMPHRRDMIQQIVKMLKKDKNGSPEWLNKLPQMAKQLEVSLYRNAASFDEYMDMATLKQRLQLIAMEVSIKAKGQNGDRSSSSGNDRHRTNDRNNMYPNGMSSNHHDISRASSQGNSQQYRPNQASASQMPSNHMMRIPNQRNPLSGKSDDNGRLGEVPDSGSNSLARQASDNRYSGSSRSNTFEQSTRRGAPSNNPSVSALPQRNDPEWKIRIRHKQQRLLLLHHSAKCPYENGACSVTPHCADMKRLWRHMEGCKDNNCQIPHCFSSRAILSHYRKCKDTHCPACGPVRETVSKAAKGNARSSRRAADAMRPTVPVHGTQSKPRSHDMPGPNAMLPSPASVPGRGSAMNIDPSSVRGRSHPGRSSMPPPMSDNDASSALQFPAASSSSFKGNDATGSQNIAPSFDDSAIASSSNDNSSSVGRKTPQPQAGGGTSRGRDSSEWEKVRHKQQRLLLLRHASKCHYEGGKCPVTPHCASMKKLWEHIAHCKNQQCTVQHCMSSRYVLSHYRRCKDARCPACGPVRETIRKSHEKEKLKTGSSADDKLSTMPIALQPPPEEGRKKKRPRTEDKIGSGNIVVIPPITSAPIPVGAGSKETPDVASKSVKTDDHSLLNSFSTSEIELHLASLRRAEQLPLVKLKAKCGDLLKGLQAHTHGWVFNTPVDPAELGLPDYFDVIKKPMDLGTVSRRLESGAYHSIVDFSTDVRLTFDNAMTYNEADSVVHDMAKELKIKFVADHKKMLTQLEEEDREARKNERACTLCGCVKLLFEPPVFFCNGMNCQSQRIRRNSHFYIGGNNQYFWCNPCYGELDGSIPIELVDITIMKDDLKKKKNDEVHEESWVQCDQCQSWIHQICGLFNTRQNKEHHSKYFCPKCLLAKRKNGLPPQPRPPSAAELPRTRLSDFIEAHVQSKVDEMKENLTKEKASSAGRADIDETLNELNYGPITIRQVTATDRKLEVRELVKKRYEHKNYPDEFSFRCKCFVLFQEIDGVDVVLFAIYIYEHGKDSPPPNKNCVYISYLDSVHFMRPRKLRTFVYHELLICYLDYARRKGFATAHIWACPPLKGDDYIFYAKPEDQKTPRDARLRQWYIDMLIECQNRKICGKLTNMHELYFSDEKLDGTAVPYFEGDYFPGEADNIIKDLQQNNGKKGGGAGKKSKKKSSKSKGRGGRSDDESPYGNETTASKTVEDGGRDEVMVQMGETIQPMKDSFIVAFLNPSNASTDTVRKSDARSKRKLDSGEPMKVESNSEVKVIDDDDEDMDCEFFNNRQAFLNLCRGNHYQFDELRRAKHTSMMVLWHLHNRDAPKFVQHCTACGREILTGTRYHCKTCPDYDLCEECYRSPTTNRGACSHTLHAMAVESDGTQEGPGGGTNGLTDAQRRERQRNLQLHIQLIEHASRCISPTCSSSNCAKMKSYLAHGRSCKLKASGGCKICKRIWTLLRIHAQKCKDTVCPIPQCMAIRERIRQLAKQQQAMDDRRRQEMNRAYRMTLAAQQS